MSDTNTKLHDDLMGLREAAALVLAILQDEAWWERTRLLLAQYPQRGAYELVNSQEFADALNALFVALHQDSDNDEMQERVYAALATAPESDHREIARLKGEIELLALAVNLKIGLSRKLYHVVCSHCGTRYSDASSRFPICPNCHQVARVWLRDEAEIDPEGSS